METMEKQPEAKADILNVSYSKAQTFKACKYKYDLAFQRTHPVLGGKGLMPKEKAHQLARGSHGHAVLEYFFNKVKELEFPYSAADCARLGAEAIVWGIGENASLNEEVSNQIAHLCSNVFPNLGWKILEVEKEFRLPLGTDSTGKQFVVPVTIDLIVQIGADIVVVDHKFSADAYSDERCNIESQIPIYLGILRAFKIPAKYGIYNFMRTRKMKDVANQVVQTTVRPNNFRIQRSFQEHLQTVREINGYSPAVFSRSPSNNCDYCDFKQVCAVEMRGDDATLLLEDKFEINDYGYDEK
jgi:hypothetical protein